MVWFRPAQHVQLKVTGSAKLAVVHVAGELDVASVPAVDREVQQLMTEADAVALDLSRVTFCGVAAVNWLTDLLCRPATAGRVRIERAHSEVVRMLRLPGEPAGLQIAQNCRTAVGIPDRRDDIAYLDELLSTALRISGTGKGNAQLYVPERRALVIAAQHGFHRPFLSYFEAVPDDDEQTSCGTAAGDRAAVFVEEVATSPIFWGTPSLDVLNEEHVAAVASVPITAPGGRLMGVVSVHAASPRRWSLEQRRALSSLARANQSSPRPRKALV
ncbi:STAS domain-containing protein [Streptomyces sp. NPDC050400]|uniref:STAS domain-containing protein n=1 Tax=Streptomyces sp. NPDC050400 TaxID=3365610 RepID=UPI0037BD0B6E